MSNWDNQFPTSEEDDKARAARRAARAETHSYPKGVVVTNERLGGVSAPPEASAARIPLRAQQPGWGGMTVTPAQEPPQPPAESEAITAKRAEIDRLKQEIANALSEERDVSELATRYAMLEAQIPALQFLEHQRETAAKSAERQKLKDELRGQWDVVAKTQAEFEPLQAQLDEAWATIDSVQRLAGSKHDELRWARSKAGRLEDQLRIMGVPIADLHEIMRAALEGKAE